MGLKLAALGDGEVVNAKAKQIETYWAPRNAKAVKLMPGMSAGQALRVVMAECLGHIVRNAALLAEIDTQGVYRLDTTEHVHQLRVGIRRMRTAWSVFNGLCALPPEAQRSEVKKHFSRLGGSRDNQVLFNDLLPALQAAGQPALVFETQAIADDASEVAKDPLFQSWLLDMCEFVNTAPSPPPSPPAEESPTTPRVKKLLLTKLHKWHRKILRDGVQFAMLEMQARHDLRKRVKKLRYAMQFADALLPEKALSTYLKALSQVQNILGDMNDLYTALEKFSLLRDTQPSAWFACGWITHKLDLLQTDAVTAFQKLSKDSYWD
jgi:CHAD domain-containing protein